MGSEEGDREVDVGFGQPLMSTHLGYWDGVCGLFGEMQADIRGHLQLILRRLQSYTHPVQAPRQLRAFALIFLL